MTISAAREADIEWTLLLAKRARDLRDDHPRGYVLSTNFFSPMRSVAFDDMTEDREVESPRIFADEASAVVAAEKWNAGLPAQFVALSVMPLSTHAWYGNFIDALDPALLFADAESV